ncbi:GGDEF domain-containing protein, partial [Marinomonas sp. 15G1-11]
ELIQDEINKHDNTDHHFCLSILDIDHFKEVNDTYGHQKGDQVLIEIANILKSNLKETGFVGRYGGEEFIVLYPESSIDDVVTTIESLRLAIWKHDFNGIPPKTASFGLTCSIKGDTIEALIKRADNALYEAKNSGRNKVIIK